jgi:transcriptional regulator with XRE-family HTH domain
LKRRLHIALRRSLSQLPEEMHLEGTWMKSKKAKQKRRTVRDHGPDPIDEHVGHRVRQARHLAGLSQMELGAAVGVSFQAVQKYEQGETRLSASRLLMVAKILHCGVSFFFEGIDPHSVATSGSTLGPDQVELIRSLRLIANEQIRAELRAFIKQVSITYAEPDRDVDRREVS